MIEVRRDGDAATPYTTVILSPDRSLDWEGNKKVIWSLGGLCIGIALGFTIIAGTWVMLPFAGLEVLALSSALYYVSWKLSYRHIITLGETTLVIEKGVYRPRGKWQWVKQETQLRVEPPKHDWEAPSLSFINNNEQVDIGDFLSPDDAEQMISLMREHILVNRQAAR